MAIEDKNLHEYIHPPGNAAECHHYHNKDRHSISSISIKSKRTFIKMFISLTTKPIELYILWNL